MKLLCFLGQLSMRGISDGNRSGSIATHPSLKGWKAGSTLTQSLIIKRKWRKIIFLARFSIDSLSVCVPSPTHNTDWSLEFLVLDHYLWPTFPHLVFNNHVVAVGFGMGQRPARREPRSEERCIFLQWKVNCEKPFWSSQYLRINPMLVPIDLQIDS